MLQKEEISVSTLKNVCDKDTHHAFLDFKAEVTQTFENCLWMC